MIGLGGGSSYIAPLVVPITPPSSGIASRVSAVLAAPSNIEPFQDAGLSIHEAHKQQCNDHPITITNNSRNDNNTPDYQRIEEFIVV
jgi:hypothetical protein